MIRILLQLGIALLLLLAVIPNTGRSADDASEIQWGQEINGCRFSATTDRPSYRFDEPIPLNFVLENVGNEPMIVRATDAMKIYRFDVRRADGKPAPLTSEGRRQSNDLEGSENMSIKFPPGARRENGIAMLNRLYDMTLLGEYTVTVYREIWQKDGNKSFEVPSKKLKIVVREYNAEEIKAQRQQKSNEE